jgi:hypothetical protein
MKRRRRPLSGNANGACFGRYGRKAAITRSLTFGGISVAADPVHILGKKLGSASMTLKSLDFLDRFWYRMDLLEHRFCASVTT